MKPTLKPAKRKMWLAIIPTPQAVPDRQVLTLVLVLVLVLTLVLVLVLTLVLVLVLVLTLARVLALVQVPRRKVRHRVVRLPVSLPHQQRLANSRNSLILAV